MYEIRFGEAAPSRLSVDQLRGIEDARVRKSYELLAKRYGVKWKGRKYNLNEWDASDLPNRCLSAATACLYRYHRSCRAGGRLCPGRRIHT